MRAMLWQMKILKWGYIFINAVKDIISKLKKKTSSLDVLPESGRRTTESLIAEENAFATAEVTACF